MASKSKQYCSVPQCSNYASKTVSIHTFPKSEKLKKRWQFALKIGKPISKYMVVCSDHFQPDDYFKSYQIRRKRCLKRGVIPSRKIPASDQLEKQNGRKTKKVLLTVTSENREAPKMASQAVTDSNSDDLCEFKIKVEEIIIKEEHEDPVDTATEENADLIDDPRQFVIMKTDSGPPYNLIDRFSNTVIRVDPTMRSIEDLNGTLTCYVQLVKLTENAEIPKKTAHKCDECGKCFGSSTNLKSHLVSHTAEKLFQCSCCRKCFKRKSALQAHIKTHVDKKRFECDQCEKTFSYKSNLKSHILIHKQKSFDCNQCEKCFNKKGNLNRHMRTHNDEKQFKCEEKGKHSAKKETLKVPESTQRNKAPIKPCEMTFSQNWNLKASKLREKSKKSQAQETSNRYRGFFD